MEISEGMFLIYTLLALIGVHIGTIIYVIVRGWIDAHHFPDSKKKISDRHKDIIKGLRA